MGQTIVFEADRESPVTETQVRRLGAVLRSLLDREEGFGRLRVEIEADSALDLAFAHEEELLGPPLSEAVEEAEEEGAGVEETEAEGTETEEEEPSLEELRDQQKESDELPTVNPGTRRYTLASVLYHADGYLTTPEIVELSQGEEWEMDQSAASADLYNMYRDFVVHRRERVGEGTYEYWLTDDGVEAVEQSEDAIEPNPFEETETGDAEGDEAET